MFLSLDELRYVADRRRMDYNRYRPHISLGYVTPTGRASGIRMMDISTEELASEHNEYQIGV